MANWQDKFEKRGLDTSSNERYISSLRRIGYATDPLHGKKVRSTFNKYFEEVDNEEQAKLVILAAL
jgi:flagellum-specific peptidoglycan hydrolase FlgJ